MPSLFLLLFAFVDAATPTRLRPVHRLSTTRRAATNIHLNQQVLRHTCFTSSLRRHWSSSFNNLGNAANPFPKIYRSPIVYLQPRSAVDDAAEASNQGSVEQTNGDVEGNEIDAAGGGGDDDQLIITRVFTSEDSGVDEARELIREYEESLEVDIAYQNIDEEVENLPGLYGEDHGGILLVARRGNKAAGVVAMRKAGNDWCEMKRLYVRAEERGNGLGRQLVARIIEEARSMGRYRVLRIDSVKSLEAALQLYTSFGFYPIEPYCKNPHPDAAFLELDLNTVDLAAISEAQRNDMQEEDDEHAVAESNGMQEEDDEHVRLGL